MYSLFLSSLKFYPAMYASLLTYLGLFDVPAFRTFFRPAFFASEREFVDLNSGTKSLGKSLSPISLSLYVSWWGRINYEIAIDL